MLTIYHIEGRRSQSVIWLCEELGLDYELVFKRGDIAGSLATVREVNPLLPLAPTIRYDEKLMVETSAILEFLLARHGDGRLVPPLASPDLIDHLQWLHFAEGTAMSRISADMDRMRRSGVMEITPNLFPGSTMELVGVRHVVRFIEAHLAERPYFGGAAFSAADIMMYFPARMIMRLPLDPGEYAGIAAWMPRVEARDGFKRAQARGLPDGAVPGEGRTMAMLMTGKPA